jgi:gluconate 2-dehydrogenase gamma chain
LFSARQALVLEDAMERIIPETNTPGAKSAGIGEWLESTLLDTYEESVRKSFVAGLDALDHDARQEHAAGFCECTPVQQTGLLERLVASLPPQGGGGPNEPQPFFLLLRELTVIGFCSSKLGATRVVGHEPMPGGYEGCVVNEGAPRAG